MKPRGKKGLTVQIQAVWRESGAAAPRVDVWPEKHDAERRFLFANSAGEVLSVFGGKPPDGWFVIDAVELYRLVFPESPAADLDGLLPAGPGEERDAKLLWKLWQKCETRLDAIPVWALEHIALILRELDCGDLAELLQYWASTLDTPETSRRWQDSFAHTVKRVERSSPPPVEDCTPLNVDDVASYLGEGGALARLVDGYEPRPGQIQMLRAVTAALNSGHHLVVEAGTGIGKSLAYLLPAALWAKLNDVPVVVSTNTKNLQSQLVEKDLPAVMRMMDEAGAFPDSPPLAAAVIKGRSNYLCLRRFAQMMDGGEFDLPRPEMRMFASAIAWSVTTPDGDFDALTCSGAVDPSFVQQLSSSSEECAGRGCPYHGRCFIQKAREKSLRANLVVANHSLVFAELGAESPISLPAYSQIIFDEAHNLEEAATKYFTSELSPGEVSAVVRRIAQMRGRKSRGALHDLKKRFESGAVGVGREEELRPALDAAFGAVRRFTDASDSLFRALHKLVGAGESPRRYKFAPVDPCGPLPAPTPEWGAARDAQVAFGDTLAKLRKSLEQVVSIVQGVDDGELNLAAGDVGDLSAAVGRLEELAATAEMVLGGADDSYVFWVQRSRAPGAVGEALAAPIDVGEFIAKNLYDRKASVILCSATLSVAGSFNYAASRLGLGLVPPGRLDKCVAPSPFDYLGQCSLLVPAFLPEPVAQDRSYVGELTNLVLQLASEYKGRTLVLFTSYEMMAESAELIRAELEVRGLDLLVQGESGSRNRITRLFREDGGSVLYGTQSFWEGVDVVGEALSCVVVARLPFASPTDPVNSARCEEIDKAGGRSFFSYTVPMAVLKLRQGFGRLIRHRLDHGTVVVADTRLVTKGYGAAFRNSLPAPIRKCASIDEVLANLK